MATVYILSGSGNWVCPPDVTSITVECWGPGGKGGYKSLLDHKREWAQLLGLLVWVDAFGEVHNATAASLPDPSYILHEGYEA
jgi:hypothetical protein